MLTDLDVAVRKSGLRVVEVPGWKTRGRPTPMGQGAPKGVIVHHTATPAKAAGNYPSLRVVRDGHGGQNGLPGPLSQLGLGRDGTVYVIAAGRCNHAGLARPREAGNSWAIGIEAEHPGVGTWPHDQYQAYVALVAALTEHYGISSSAVWGHKEIAVDEKGRLGRKSDPNFDMGAFRVAVDAARKAGAATTLEVPPRDPNYGHRGIPALLAEDGLWGGGTLDAFMWAIGGDRLTGLTRANWRTVQSWAGRPRTGLMNDGDVRAIQTLVGSRPDGDWPRARYSDTTLCLQRWINHRIRDARGENP